MDSYRGVTIAGRDVLLSLSSSLPFDINDGGWIAAEWIQDDVKMRYELIRTTVTDFAGEQSSRFIGRLYVNDTFMGSGSDMRPVLDEFVRSIVTEKNLDRIKMLLKELDDPRF